MNAPAAPLVARLRAEIADLRRQLAAKQAEIDDALAVIEGPSTIKEALSIFHTEHVLLHEAREQLAAANERTSLTVALALRKAAVAALYWCEAADENKIENAILSISVGDTLEKLEALERDAERYRWLRDKSADHQSQPPTTSLQAGRGIKVTFQSYGMDERSKPTLVLIGVALDAAIDASAKEST